MVTKILARAMWLLMLIVGSIGIGLAIRHSVWVFTPIGVIASAMILAVASVYLSEKMQRGG